jgi:hypothetical protein
MRYNQLNGAIRDLISAIIYVAIGTVFGVVLSIIYMLHIGAL